MKLCGLKMGRNNDFWKHTVTIAIVLYIGGMNQFHPVQYYHNAEGNHGTRLERTTCLSFTPLNGQYVLEFLNSEKKNGF